LPWSTWAIMATLRRFIGCFFCLAVQGDGAISAEDRDTCFR
jgi:hypothetical protein